MRRRALFGAMGATIMGGLAASAEAVRHQIEHALALPPTDADIGEWRWVANQYASNVSRWPADEFLPDLLADLDEVRRNVEVARDSQRAPLVGVVAKLSAAASVSLVAAGNWREADRYWRTAMRAIQACNDRELGCQIAGQRAVFNLYRPGAAPTAMDHADRALSMAGDKPWGGAASALAARAQFLAMEGEAAGAVSSLREMESRFNQMPEVVRSDETRCGWSIKNVLHVRSFVYSHIGDVRRANAAQDAVMGLYHPTKSLGREQVRFHQALCMVVAGDPSQGALHAANVLGSLDPQFRGGHMRTTAGMVLKALPPQAKQLPAVRDVRELMEAPSTAAGGSRLS